MATNCRWHVRFVIKPDLMKPYVVLGHLKVHDRGRQFALPLTVLLALVAMEQTPSTILMHDAYHKK